MPISLTGTSSIAQTLGRPGIAKAVDDAGLFNSLLKDYDENQVDGGTDWLTVALIGAGVLTAAFIISTGAPFATAAIIAELGVNALEDYGIIAAHCCPVR